MIIFIIFQPPPPLTLGIIISEDDDKCGPPLSSCIFFTLLAQQLKMGIVQNFTQEHVSKPCKSLLSLVSLLTGGRLIVL